MKIGTVVKIVNIAGSVLGVAASLMSGWAQQKATKAEIAKQVNEALKNSK